jgi:hypothetical protein
MQGTSDVEYLSAYRYRCLTPGHKGFSTIHPGVLTQYPMDIQKAFPFVLRGNTGFTKG